jgi:hypothetical protein
MKVNVIFLALLALFALPGAQAALVPNTTILQVKQMSEGLSFQVVLNYQGEMNGTTPEFYVPASATDAIVAVSTPRFEKKLESLAAVGTMDEPWSGFDHWRVDFAKFNVSREGSGRFGLTLSYNVPNATHASFASAMPTGSFAVFMDPLRQFSPSLEANGKSVSLVAQSLTDRGQTFGTLPNSAPAAENEVLAAAFNSDSRVAGEGLAGGLVIGLIVGGLLGFLVMAVVMRRKRKTT